MENTTNTKNDIENVSMKMQSKNKSKERMKSKVKRDASVLDKAEEALLSLASSAHVDEVQDKDVVKNSLRTILELKGKGVSYGAIHQKLVETVGLRISLVTMKGYVQQYKTERGLVERRSKNGSRKIQISIPEQFEDGLLQLVEQINAAPTQQVHIAGVEMAENGPPKINWEVWFNRQAVVPASIN